MVGKMTDAEMGKLYIQIQFDNMVRSLRDLVTAYFEDPVHQAEFEEWKQKRETKKEEEETEHEV